MDGEGKKTASSGKKGKVPLKRTPKVKRGGATSVKTQKKKPKKDIDMKNLTRYEYILR